MIRVHIGVDDVDSIQGGCTTHFSTILAYRLKREVNVEFLDYLNLVRLNPSVPYKTRGNGAVAIRVAVESEDDVSEIWEIAKQMVYDYTSELKDPKHQPVIALLEGDVNEELSRLAEKALFDIVPLDLAFRVAEKTNIKYYAPKGLKRGLVGALASIGYTMLNIDHTYELIAYRKREYWGTPRLVDPHSIIELDKLYGNLMILNYDPQTGRILVTPRGSDPVLLGLRGEDPGVLAEAFKLVKVYEPIEYIAIFRTNQHTDSHIHPVNTICRVRPYTCVKVVGRVKSKPRRSTGGHVFFELCDENCCITVAVYEPTKDFRNIAEKLYPGDLVEVYGCIRPPGPTHGITLNLEKLRVIELAEVVVFENPRCPLCGSRMESMGKNKGYRCRKCKYKDASASKVSVTLPRDLKPGWYQPPYSAFKHLMKPIERFGKEKAGFDGQVKYDVVVKLT